MAWSQCIVPVAPHPMSTIAFVWWAEPKFEERTQKKQENLFLLTSLMESGELVILQYANSNKHQQYMYKDYQTTSCSFFQ